MAEWLKLVPNSMTAGIYAYHEGVADFIMEHVKEPGTHQLLAFNKDMKIALAIIPLADSAKLKDLKTYEGYPHIVPGD